MTEQGVFDFEGAARTADLLEGMIDRADRILVKKLSKNDRGLGQVSKSTNQDGCYIPAEHRDGGFFPHWPRRTAGRRRQADPGDVVHDTLAAG